MPTVHNQWQRECAGIIDPPQIDSSIGSIRAGGGANQDLTNAGTGSGKKIVYTRQSLHRTLRTPKPMSSQGASCPCQEPVFAFYDLAQRN